MRIDSQKYLIAAISISAVLFLIPKVFAVDKDDPMVAIRNRDSNPADKITAITFGIAQSSFIVNNGTISKHQPAPPPLPPRLPLNNGAISKHQPAPPSPVNQDIFAEVNKKINDITLPFIERFPLLFPEHKAISTESVLARSAAPQVIDTSALMATLNSGESAFEKLKKIREEKAAKGAKPAVVTKKAVDKPNSLEEELAVAVKKNPIKTLRPIVKAISLKDEIPENLISIAEEVGYPLTEQQKTYLHEGQALKLKIDAGENLSRKENALVMERTTILSAIDNSKKAKVSELIAQRKESSAKKKVEIATDLEALAAAERRKKAREMEMIQKADAKKISLQEAQSNIDNISSIHARLVCFGREQLLVRGKTPTKPAVSPQLLKKLVIQGIVPEGREMFEKGSIINQFKSAEQTQLNDFMLEMPEAYRLSVKDLIAFFDNEGNLSPIIGALGQKTKHESTTFTPVMTASDDRTKLLSQIQAGFKLRKATGLVKKKPEVAIDTPVISDKAEVRQALATRMGSVNRSTSGVTPVTLAEAQANIIGTYLKLEYQGKGIFLARGMGDKVPVINKSIFKELINNSLVPTPLEMYGIETRDIVKLLTTKLPEINRAKLKLLLMEKAVNGEVEFIEAFITIIEREDTQLGRELRTPLSEQEISLLKKVEIDLKGVDEQTATALAQDRADKSAKLAEILAEAEKSRKKGLPLKPLSKKTELLVNDILDSEGNKQIKEDLVKNLLVNNETADSESDKQTLEASSMDKAASYLAHMQNLEGKEIKQEIKNFKRRANPMVSEVCNMLFSSMFTQFENRMLMVGAVAGEEVKKLNESLWISGFYGAAKQGSSSNSDSYRTNTGGIIIGADINLGENEANLIGVAYGKARSKFKMSQTIGDKFNVNHDIFSIYGQGEIVNRLLLQGAVSFIKGKVINKSVKLVDVDRYEAATGKFSSKGYNVRSQLSYKFNIDKFVLTPSIGLKYGKITDGAYDETGNDVFNLSVTSKSRKIFSGMAGIKASMPQVLAENIHFVPSLNFSVERILQDKVKQAKVKLNWADREFENDTNNRKLPKLGYNIGGSALVKRNNTEIEASYNYHLKKKYVGHQGALKLKVLF